MKDTMFIILLLLGQAVYGQNPAQDTVLLQESAPSTPESMNLMKSLVYGYLTVGDNLKFKGDLLGAEQQYDSALIIADALIAAGSSPRMIIFSSIYEPYDRLGHLYLLTNDLNKAELYFKMAAEKMHGLPKNSVFRIPPLVGIGEVYFAKENFGQAKLYFDEAEKKLNAATTSLYSYDPLRRTILFNQFEVLLKVKDYKHARKVINSLSTGGMFFSTGVEGTSQIPRVFELKSRYYLETGAIDKAELYIQKAKEFAVALSAPLLQFRIMKTEALINWTKNDIGAATQNFNQLINAYKMYILENFAAMTEYEREAFYAKAKEDFEIFNAFILANKDRVDSDLVFAMAYDNQLFSKALLLNALNKLKSNILKSDDDDLKSKFMEWELAKTHLSALYYEKKKDLAEISRTEKEIESLERGINQKTSFLTVINNEVHWQQVRAELVDGEAALEIVRTKSFSLFGESSTDSKYHLTDSITYMVLLLTKDSTNPKGFFISNGNELEGKILNYYRNSIRYMQEDNISYKMYWSPIEEYFSGVNRVYISSDGVYNQINLNTLRNPVTGNYLLDEINLVFVTNTKDLVGSKVASQTKNATLFGRPSYSAEPTQAISGVADLSSNNYIQRSIRSEAFDSFREQSFSDLPATEDEIRNIEQVLADGGWQAEAYFGSDATETRLKTTINPSILHIATHGFFLQEDLTKRSSSMIGSGIILAGVNNINSSAIDDGILTAYEATNLHLDSTLLVVLSACETGLGVVKNGEGVYGLQRGFIVAGTKYVLMSLWKVDDFATRFLMETFYKKWLAGNDIHESMKQAQQELRIKYDAPYYWGAFILLGI